MQRAPLCTLVLLGSLAMACAKEPKVMTADDLLGLPHPAPDHRIAYDDDPLTYGELRLPEGSGPHPVAIVVHGGCWLAEYGLDYMSALSRALADEGVATWSIEYRRIGDDGGGWPGTFEDVAAAADRVGGLADRFAFDLGRVVALGHSAGGHLALWLAARSRLPSDDPLRGQSPLALAGVVALAGIPDLAAYSSPAGCGSAVPDLLGGEPDAVPKNLRRASPIELVPLDVPQILVIGELDDIVPEAQASSYAAAARAAGDRVAIRSVADAGHFELVDPGSVAWPVVVSAVRELIGGT